MDRKQQLYVWLAGLFVTALIVADLTGGRFFRFGTVDLSVGMLALTDCRPSRGPTSLIKTSGVVVWGILHPFHNSVR